MTSPDHQGGGTFQSAGGQTGAQSQLHVQRSMQAPIAAELRPPGIIAFEQVCSRFESLAFPMTGLVTFSNKCSIGLTATSVQFVNCHLDLWKEQERANYHDSNASGCMDY
jgi:hypothetical protein